MEEQRNEAEAQAPQRKQRSNSAYIFSNEDGNLVWAFPGIGKLVLHPDKVSAVNRARFIVHGMKQRVNDAMALDAGENGKVDPRAKFEEGQRMIEHLESGTDEWNMRASAASGPASYVTQALIAIKAYQGRDVSDPDKANAFVREVAEAPKLKLGGEMGKARKWLEANSKVIREKIAEIHAAQAPAVDADAELANLMGGDAG